MSGGNFVKYTARFDGTVNADVEAFLNNVVNFKDCSQISDEYALRSLSMLLNGFAATWWQVIKNTVLTWEDTVQALKDAYSKKLVHYLLFREVFSREQNSGEPTELFVSHIRALHAQLPYTLTEEVQLDMVYSLLVRKLRKRLPRYKFYNFKELLMESIEIEASLKEGLVATDSDRRQKPQ
ncbi:activity-regulated cytoskeleton associated protein 1-like [Diabrotica undecimpunctata]|uniref:activity-regulated cytoskeleton associated protein 1-like n=1 Tax=Diabrotica undecimpunctata TaxID=50387 RepID=UPI003B638E9E